MQIMTWFKNSLKTLFIFIEGCYLSNCYLFLFFLQLSCVTKSNDIKLIDKVLIRLTMLMLCYNNLEGMCSNAFKHVIFSTLRIEGDKSSLDIYAYDEI